MGGEARTPVCGGGSHLAPYLFIMQSKGYLRASSVAVFAIACGDVTTERTADRTPGLGTNAEALSGACSSATLQGGWISGDLGQRTGTFTVELDATPSTQPEDALFGLSHGVATRYTDLAAITRFSPAGTIDARNGSSYGADAPLGYGAGVTQRLGLDVNTVTHTYSVRAISAAGSLPLATNYAFRTEQANASVLDHFALKVDAGGPLGVCNVTVQVPGQCRVAIPSGGFVNGAFASQAVGFTASFTATPAANGVDGVVGLSAVPAAGFADLATAVRFNPAGTIDVRNATDYTADTVVPYVAGKSYAFVLIVDVMGHAYSVLVDGTLIARNYAFRSQQANVSSLANLAIIADSTIGPVTACGFVAAPSQHVAYMHDTNGYSPTSPWMLAARSDGKLLVAETTRTLTLDPQGKKIGEVPHGGFIALDGAGDIYLVGYFTGTYDGGGGPLVSAGDRDVYVSKYDPAWHHLWSRRFGEVGDEEVSMPDVDAGGDLIVRISNYTTIGNSHATRLDPAGNVLWTVPVSNTASVALDPAGNALIGEDPPEPGGFSITKLSRTAATLWSRRVQIVSGTAGLQHIRADAAGNVVIAGPLNGTIDFGGPSVTAGKGPNSQTYLAKFSASGANVFSTFQPLTADSGLTLDGAGNPTISGYTSPPDLPRMVRFDATGQYLAETTGRDLIDTLDEGVDGAAVADQSGNLYWVYIPRTSVAPISVMSYLVKFRP